MTEVSVRRIHQFLKKYVKRTDYSVTNPSVFFSYFY